MAIKNVYERLQVFAWVYNKTLSATATPTTPALAAEAISFRSGRQARAAKSGERASPASEACGQPACLDGHSTRACASKTGGYSPGDSSVSGSCARNIRPQKPPA